MAINSRARFVIFDVPVESTEDQSEMLAILNQRLERLARSRLTEIVIGGPFRKSKLAWKLATYSQPMLYRVVELASAGAIAWNARNMLGLSLAVRSFIETAAELLDFKRQFDLLFEARRTADLDQLLMARSFSSRDKEWLASHPDMQAINVMTLVQKLDKNTLEGVWAHYELLSERCHPNSYGHHHYFGSLDTSTGTTLYSNDAEISEFRKEVAAIAILIDECERCFIDIDTMIVPVSEWHWRISMSNDS